MSPTSCRCSTPRPPMVGKARRSVKRLRAHQPTAPGTIAGVERIEIAVVGGGPAGATAARLLAERGARVVLLESRSIPRPKLCGGGLTPKALPYFAGAAAQTIERRIHRIEL